MTGSPFPPPPFFFNNSFKPPSSSSSFEYDLQMMTAACAGGLNPALGAMNAGLGRGGMTTAQSVGMVAAAFVPTGRILSEAMRIFCCPAVTKSMKTI